jgi:hypothetical protein
MIFTDIKKTVVSQPEGLMYLKIKAYCPLHIYNNLVIETIFLISFLEIFRTIQSNEL